MTTNAPTELELREKRLKDLLDAYQSARECGDGEEEALRWAFDQTQPAALAPRSGREGESWSDRELEQRLAIAFCEEMHADSRRRGDVACGDCFDAARLLMLDHRGALRAVIEAARSAPPSEPAHHFSCWRNGRCEHGPSAKPYYCIDCSRMIVATPPSEPAPEIEDDPHATLDLLLISAIEGEPDDPMRWLPIIESWTPEQRRTVEEYCGAVHLRASDNDDVVVPPRPAILDTLRPGSLTS